MSTASDNLERLEYRPELFVGREEQVQDVLDNIRRMCRAEDVRKRVHVFVGETAMGKTWLLKAIHNAVKTSEFSQQCLIHEFTLPLRSTTENESDATLEVRQIMVNFAQEVLKIAHTEATLPALSRMIMDSLTQRFQTGKYLVVFLDAVYETAWNFLELFEEHLLGPLALRQEVFIVMAGRGRKFPWTAPELRFHSTIEELTPFTEAETTEQLQSYTPTIGISGEAITERLYQYSNGVPGINYWLTKDKNFLQGEAPTLLADILNQLLHSVDSTARDKIVQYIEALCVLRVFDDDRISAMIQAHPSIKSELTSDNLFQTAVEIRRTLVQESLAGYRDEEGAYQLDESIRKLASENLKQNQPQLWQDLHKAALDLYKQWAENYKRTAERWQKEAKYHEDELAA